MIYALLLVVGIFAGVVNTLAGGGSLITVPLLIFMGLTGASANATNRIAVWIQCVTAVHGFRTKGVSDFKTGWFLAVPATIGAVLGAQFAVELSDELFKKILAVVMVVVTALVVWQPDKNPSVPPPQTTLRKAVLAGAFFFVGFYGGFIQAGVGYLITAALTLVCGINLVNTAAVKSFIVAVYTTFAVVIFIINGQIDWWLAAVLAAGNGIGGYLGSHLAVKKGEKIIRIALVVTVFFMALKLLGLFPDFAALMGKNE